MIDVTSPNFTEQSLRASQPELEQIADEHSSVRVVGPDIDEVSALAERYGALSIPMIVRFDGGEPSRGFAGLKPELVLKRAPGLCRPCASRSGEVKE